MAVESGVKRTPANQPRTLVQAAAACLLIGLALSALSVPVAALVSQRWGAFSGGLVVMMIVKVVRLDDGTVYLLDERPSSHSTMRGPPRLLRLRSSQPLSSDSRLASMIDASRYQPQPDPRPGFLRHMPEGYSTVQAYSSGWPWHAGHSATYSGIAGTRTVGKGSIKLGGDTYVLPFLPIWRGVLANTLFYGVLVFLPWAGLRWARMAHRRRHARCEACGYTLGMDMDRCPECGRVRPALRYGLGTFFHARP